jgi:hypothetical protein
MGVAHIIAARVRPPHRGSLSLAGLSARRPASLCTYYSVKCAPQTVCRCRGLLRRAFQLSQASARASRIYLRILRVVCSKHECAARARVWRARVSRFTVHVASPAPHTRLTTATTLPKPAHPQIHPHTHHTHTTTPTPTPPHPRHLPSRHPPTRPPAHPPSHTHPALTPLSLPASLRPPPHPRRHFRRYTNIIQRASLASRAFTCPTMATPGRMHHGRSPLHGALVK